MKKSLSIFFIILLGLSLNMHAQTETEYKISITANVGLSLVGSLIDVSDLDATADYSTKVLPAGQISADYFVTNWLSMGVAGSYQFMQINYTNYGDNNVDFSTNIDRINVAFRPLFHYVNKGRVDMYSGLRLGLTNWGINTTETVQNYEPTDYISFNSGTVFAPQLVAFGIRGYFTDFIGANVEFAIGAPHYISGGISLRL
jgi:hypothetical protein